MYPELRQSLVFTLIAMNKITIFIISLTTLLSCTKNDIHPEWKELNMGYKYDSIKYLENPGTDYQCNGNHEHTFSFEWHQCFCPLYGYIPYIKLPYRNMSYNKVLSLKGEPMYCWVDTVYYGYRRNRWGDVVFGIKDFYDPEGYEIFECQEFYRVSKILNKARSVILTATWIDDYYLTMSFLLTSHDTISIHGFQSIREYPSYWQY